MFIENAEHIYPHLVKLRRAFHRRPELAFEEEHTAALIMKELDRLQIPYEYSGKGGGVIAHMDFGGVETPTVALRADMDGLPGEETTGLPFSSRNPGVMHACGHDGHMAMLLGAASLLKEAPPRGNVRLIFQPAEERGGGAKVIIRSGGLKGVTAIFGGHITRRYRVGKIMVADGVITAHSDRFAIHVQGKGGHGARPHEAVDAVVVAGLLITAIQTLVSREINPTHPSVVTIGRVEAGSAANVIAEKAILQGTIRSTRPEVREHIHKGLKRMAKAVAALHNASIRVEIESGYPPVVNSTFETAIAQRAVEKLLGRKGVAAMDHPSMGSEDFSYYLQQVPGCYVRFGACAEGCEHIPLHSPSFDFAEPVLKIGAAYFAQVVSEAIDAYRRRI